MNNRSTLTTHRSHLSGDRSALRGIPSTLTGGGSAATDRRSMAADPRPAATDFRSNATENRSNLTEFRSNSAPLRSRFWRSSSRFEGDCGFKGAFCSALEVASRVFDPKKGRFIGMGSLDGVKNAAWGAKRRLAACFAFPKSESGCRGLVRQNEGWGFRLPGGTRILANAPTTAAL
jgi:hypothetical protein